MTTLSSPTKKPSPLAQAAQDFYIQQMQLLNAATDDPALKAFRHCVAERFAQQGFPTRRDEDWKYTPLNAFLQTHYTVSGVAKVDEAQLKTLLPPFDVMHLVFIDGYFSERFSDDLSELPAGLTIEPVKDALDFSAGHQALMAHESKIEAQPFGCLNSLLFDDGVLIQLEPHCVVERPILCSFVQTQHEHANTLRNRVVLAHGAQLTLIEQHVSFAKINAFNNCVTEIEVAQNARLDQVILQDIDTGGMHFSLQFIEQAKNSVVNSHYVGLGAQISRHQSEVRLGGEHIESSHNSACLATGTQIMDTRTYTEHQAWWGTSRQLHKLVLDDKAIGVFNGMIKVARGAQKTDGMMDNKNLLLSREAQVDSKPQLEIYADDVKCSHGSASGQISEEQIFYLRARGIREADARRLVTQAFLLEPLETISAAPIRQWLANKLTRKLNAQIFGTCHDAVSTTLSWLVSVLNSKETFMFDHAALRAQFPILQLTENGHPLVYLDNASTSQKPQCVIDAVERYYLAQNANVHRGVYGLSERGTQAFEAVRDQVKNLLNAREREEVIFVRGATEGINLVAQSWGRANLQAGDEVVVSEMEHHSNIVPWQMLRDQLGIKIVKWPINERGELDINALPGLVGARTKLICVTQMSNALGSINPIADIVKIAHLAGAKVLVDGAQSVSHMAVDVQALDCDFLVFSGHKMYAPTGIGCLYAKSELLEAMPPYQGGGDMIYSVTFEKTEYNQLPYKFEAGTPNIAGVIGLGAALNFINELGFEKIEQIERDLLAYATTQLSQIEGLRIIGTAQHKGAVVSFVVEGAHPHDLATLLDQDGVAVRASHHCAMPVMQKFNVPATVRASFGIYNNRADIDQLVCSVQDALDMLR